MSVTNAPSTTLVVDLDGTLVATDTLVESVIKLLRRSPGALLRFPLWLSKGKAAFKEAVAARVTIAADLLPYRQPLVTYLREQKAIGRRILLATAAHRSIAEAVAGYLDLFDGILCTESGRNLEGKAKLDAILGRVGQRFAYAGDSRADLPIWMAAEAAVLVGVAPATAARVRQRIPVEREFSRSRLQPGLWLRALRVYQWLKNLLVFVPLMTAFSFVDPERLLKTSVTFLAFSLAASATYVVNDLLDLESDRAHPRKRLRPFASGLLSIVSGLIVVSVVLALALGLAFAVEEGVLLMLATYVLLTSTYSWVLKGYVLVDVIALALLYTLRILTGSVAAGVHVSSWLLAFSVFVFLSLALMKRCAELVSIEQGDIGAGRGRDYGFKDLVVLWPLGIGAALSAVVVFGLFISAPETKMRYGTPELLWLVALGLIYWLGRLWIETSRGEMHDDPMVYAIRNQGSRITILGMIVAMLVAHVFEWGGER